MGRGQGEHGPREGRRWLRRGVDECLGPRRPRSDGTQIDRWETLAAPAIPATATAAGIAAVTPAHAGGGALARRDVLDLAAVDAVLALDQLVPFAGSGEDPGVSTPPQSKERKVSHLGLQRSFPDTFSLCSCEETSPIRL